MLSPLKVPQSLAFHKRNLAATSEKLALPCYIVDITVTSLYGKNIVLKNTANTTIACNLQVKILYYTMPNQEGKLAGVKKART
jgi:hypothetical protein